VYRRGNKEVMKKIFLILLLANVVLFVAMQRGLFGLGEQASQAQPALHEDLIRLLDAPQGVPVAALPASAPSAAPVVAPVPAPAPVAVSSAATAKSNAPVCLEWGDFTGLDLTRATAALSGLQLGDRLSNYQVEHDTGYWVYIPPLKNRAAINRKISEIKARGIREYFVVQDAGDWRNAISLGVFKTQDAAQRFLDDLQNKNVRSAQLGKRNSKFKVTIFKLNGVGILTEVKLASIQKDFAGSELKRVPCALTR
jgi:hypothetical protein